VFQAARLGSGGRTLGTDPRAWFGILPEQCIAHRIEEAALRRRLGFTVALELLDAVMGALQRFVLQQNSLHQRIKRIGARRWPCVIASSASGSRGAPSTLLSRSKRSSTSWRSCGVMASSVSKAHLVRAR
jgi:hypothetical protein